MTEIKKQELIVFAKYPEPGNVKRRLAADIGDRLSADLYRCLVEDAVLEYSQRNESVAYFITPWSRHKTFRNWLGRKLHFYPQADGDLGNRMSHAFTNSFERGLRKTILVGTDIPELNNTLVDRAFEALEESDCVIGPATDGGYYLIGFESGMFTPSVFESISWSSDQVLSQTADTLKSHNKTVKYLEPLRDIDTLDDLTEFTRRMDGCLGGHFTKTADLVLNLNL